MKLKEIFIAIFLLLCTAFSVAASSAAPEVKTVEAALKKTFPLMQIADVRPADIAGLYEVVAGQNIFFYAPKEGRLIFGGEEFTLEGKNLTAERRAQLVSALDLSKAIKVGSGPKKVIIFTDPDCPFCRKADQYFAKRTDITMYVFLTPIPSLHPQAIAKSEWILGSNDQVKAFRSVMSGQYDHTRLPPGPVGGNTVLDHHMALSKKIGVNGTPLIYVGTKMISGANIKAIEEALAKEK